MKRLNKVIAESGVASRRKADELIKAGKVKVNEEVVTELGLLVSTKDTVKVFNQAISKEEKVYYLLNKPKYVISSVKDEKRRKVVIDLFKKEDREQRIFPVGRLDFLTTGLIIITNDGELSELLAHPRREVEKEYRVTTNKILNKKLLLTLTKGVTIDDDVFVKAKKVKFVKHDNDRKETVFDLVITEGKNRQVRKMVETLGSEVKELMRIRYDFLTPKGLGYGQYRKLKIHEIKKLKQ